MSLAQRLFDPQTASQTNKKSVQRSMTDDMKNLKDQFDEALANANKNPDDHTIMKEMDMRFAARIYEYFMSPEDALYDNEESTIENRLTSELDEL